AGDGLRLHEAEAQLDCCMGCPQDRTTGQVCAADELEHECVEEWKEQQVGEECEDTRAPAPGGRRVTGDGPRDDCRSGAAPEEQQDPGLWRHARSASLRKRSVSSWAPSRVCPVFPGVCRADASCRGSMPRAVRPGLVRKRPAACNA